MEHRDPSEDDSPWFTLQIYPIEAPELLICIYPQHEYHVTQPYARPRRHRCSSCGSIDLRPEVDCCQVCQSSALMPMHGTLYTCPCCRGWVRIQEGKYTQCIGCSSGLTALGSCVVVDGKGYGTPEYFYERALACLEGREPDHG